MESRKAGKSRKKQSAGFNLALMANYKAGRGKPEKWEIRTYHQPALTPHPWLVTGQKIKAGFFLSLKREIKASGFIAFTSLFEIC